MIGLRNYRRSQGQTRSRANAGSLLKWHSQRWSTTCIGTSLESSDWLYSSSTFCLLVKAAIFVWDRFADIFHLSSMFSYAELQRKTMEKLHPLLLHPLCPQWTFFFPPLYILSVWFNISSKTATGDVQALRVCVCVLSLPRSINNECREQRALDGSAKSFWQTKDHWGQSSANRLKWFQQEMRRLCLHAQSKVIITNISIRTTVKLSDLRESVKCHLLQWSASRVVNATQTTDWTTFEPSTALLIWDFRCCKHLVKNRFSPVEYVQTSQWLFR